MNILGVPPGSNVYNLTTWPEAIVFLGIMAVIIAFMYLVVYPWAVGEAEYKKRCKKCPEEEKSK